MADRDAKGRFLKGHSIRGENPGRPTRQEVRAIRELVLEAIGGEGGFLAEIRALHDKAVTSGDVAAFGALVDRVYGKVAQPIELGRLPDEVAEIDEG